MMNFNYRKQALLYFSALLVIYAVLLVFFQRRQQKNIQTEMIRLRMEEYTDMIHEAIDKPLPDAHAPTTGILRYPDQIKELMRLFPDYLRVTIVDNQGDVVLDSNTQEKMKEKHDERPEIKQASINGTGTAIRRSATFQTDYYYFAKSYPKYFIRVAVPYTIKYVQFFRYNNYFAFLIIGVSVLAFFALYFFTTRITKSLRALKEFITRSNAKGSFEDIEFPKNDIGELSTQIKNTYLMLEKSNNKVKEEREKLIAHFSSSEEGVAFFSKRNEFIYANSHFVQLLNSIAAEPSFFINASILQYEVMKPMRDMLREKSTNFVKYNVQRNGAVCEIRGQRFPDGSFEIVLTDISKRESDKQLKYELSSSIAHELRTPVSCIRGYVETLIGNENLPVEKQQYFLQRAYTQLMRLSELIADVSTLTKMEDGAHLYPKQIIHPFAAVEEVKKDLEDRLTERKMSIDNRLAEEDELNASPILFYTIFRNLVENAIKYAGEGTTVTISSPRRDDLFQYFVVSDNGVGVPKEVNLDKLFERFYRIDQGRSREDGGSGLGLSIVRNAVLLHGGEIHAKQAAESGLEIFFSIARN